MQTKDAQSTVASTSPEHAGNVLVPVWQQLPARSLAAFVEQDLPFQMQDGDIEKRVDAVIDYPPTPGAPFVSVTEICLDPGKFSNKAGGIRQREIVDIDGTPVERDAPPRFVSINQPVVYKPAEQASYTSGPGKSIYRILSTSTKSAADGETEGSLLPREAFSFGVDGMYKGDAIPVYNKFYQRWRLGRYQAVCYATISKVAQEIGLRPTLKMIDFVGEGEREIDIATILPHYLSLTIALPDEEIINANGSMTLDPQTRAALQDLKGEFVVEWTDPEGTAWIFKFRVVKVDLIAQTHAAWISIFNSIDASESPIVRQDEAGQTSIIKGASVIDEWGGGDRQRGLFELVNGRITMFASKIEEGTHTIAEELRKSVYREFQVRPSLAQAQLALATGEIDFGGDPLQVKHLIEQLKRSRFENMLTSALVTDEVRTRFWIHVGGAEALLQEELAAFIQAAEIKPHRFLLAPKKVAPIMVLIGGWAWGYFRMKDDLRKLQAQFTQQQALRNDLRTRISQALNHIPVTNGKSAAQIEQLRSLLRGVEQTPEWPGYLTQLQEVDQQFKQLVPEQPWLKLPKSV